MSVSASPSKLGIRVKEVPNSALRDGGKVRHSMIILDTHVESVLAFLPGAQQWYSIRKSGRGAVWKRI